MNKTISGNMVRAVGTGALVLLLGTLVPMNAKQAEHEQKAGPEQKQQEARPASPKQQQERPTPVRQEQQVNGQREQQQQHQVDRPSPHGVQRADQRGLWQQHRARSWQAEHRTWQQRGGYHGYYIPAAHFRGNFGRNHRFRIHSLSLENFGGYPRFLYGGFWFSVVDPWPEYWADGWYENDDVYIDYYGDGYYLYNRRHPRDRIAITVFVN